MLKYFLEIQVDANGSRIRDNDNKKLFTGGEIKLEDAEIKTCKSLKIAKEESTMLHQGAYPVIFLNLKNAAAGTCYENVERAIGNVIRVALLQHKYLLDSDNKLVMKDVFKKYLKPNNKLSYTEITNSLKFLSKTLYFHFKEKPYILIDEYDGPISRSRLDFPQDCERVTGLIRDLFCIGLKSNDYLEKAVLTGILRLDKADLLSGLNNASEYTVLQENWAEYYGFDEVEVRRLLQEVGLASHLDTVKYWYNGYCYGGKTMYNPWSIMNFIHDEGGAAELYWVDSGSTQILENSFKSDGFIEVANRLLRGESVIKFIEDEISLDKIDTELFSLLVFTGYLIVTPVDSETEGRLGLYKLKIPNREVKEVFSEIVRVWTCEKLEIKEKEYYDIARCLEEEKIVVFVNKLQEYLLKVPSFTDLTLEKDYHNLMSGLVAPLGSNYIIKSNRKSGHGKFDHILVPRVGKGDTAIIMEYKFIKKVDLEKEAKRKEKSEEELLKDLADKGIKQINIEDYDTHVKEHTHVEKIINVSFAFSGKHAQEMHIITDLKKNNSNEINKNL